MINAKMLSYLFKKLSDFGVPFFISFLLIITSSCDTSTEKTNKQTEKEKTAEKSKKEKDRNQLLAKFREIKLGESKDEVTAFLGNDYKEFDRLVEGEDNKIVRRVYSLGFKSPKQIETEFRNHKLVMKSVVLKDFPEEPLTKNEKKEIRQNLQKLEEGMSQKQVVDILGNNYFNIRKYKTNQNVDDTYISKELMWHPGKDAIYLVYFQGGKLNLESQPRFGLNN